MGTASGYKEASMPGKDLKAGFVLNEEIAEIPDIKPGRVLTYEDIERINKVVPENYIKVMYIEKKDEVAQRMASRMKSQATLPEKDEQKTVRQERGAVPGMSESDKALGLFNEAYDSQIRQVVEKKKEQIRGKDYDQRINKIKQKNLEKFKETLKGIHSYQKQEAIEVIDHHARAHADFHSITEIEALEAGKMAKKLTQYEDKIKKFLNGVINEKRVYSAYVEEIVLDVLKDVGYKLQMALYSMIVKSYHYFDFLIAHSLQVLIVSLVTAIEMTRIINAKIEAFSEEDIRTFLAVNKKMFTIDDLINLGIAAILHDIDIRKKIPGLNKDYKFDLREESIIELHPSNGFHLSKMLNIDFDVQRAIYQHHERFDGSGFPNGLAPRFFTKYTPVLMFAEYYVEMTSPGPFADRSYSPREVLVDILSKQRERFDGDMIFAFIHAASLFPVGTWLLLSDQKIGVVSNVNRSDLTKPIVKVLFNNQLKPVEVREVNLLKNADVKIIRPLDTQLIIKANSQALNLMFD